MIFQKRMLSERHGLDFEWLLLELQNAHLQSLSHFFLNKSLTIFESPDEQDVNNRVIIISINKHTFLIAITS